jgi:superfamily II DNA/RNA helicase
MRFADIGLSDELLRAVTEAGYDIPTPIQAQAIPSVLMMKDIIGIAQTGTGKTASFVLPMIDILAHGRARARMPRSLILEPTRELAAQVAENFEKYGKYHKLSMALLIGGVQMGDQVKALEKGVDVLIATPGRLMDLFERGKILLNGCELLVIDEADRMLDMGFIPDIEHICTKLPATRQTLLFSATMPPPIKKLADKFLSNPKYIEVARPASSNLNIEQFLVDVSPAKKRDVLRDLLRKEEVATGIIFCNRKTTVRDLNKSLRQQGFRSGEIHGDIDQASRQRELDAFKSGEINLLVASDVAARGLDIKGVSHVFNFDAPWHPDDYVHRIGRTGRAGAKGKAFTFVTKADEEAIDSIEKLIGVKISRVGKVEVPEPEKTEREERRPAAKRERAAKVDEPKPETANTEPKLASAKPAQKAASKQKLDDEPGDDGWNGPVPSFLNFTLPN